MIHFEKWQKFEKNEEKPSSTCIQTLTASAKTRNPTFKNPMGTYFVCQVVDTLILLIRNNEVVHCEIIRFVSIFLIKLVANAFKSETLLVGIIVDYSI